MPKRRAKRTVKQLASSSPSRNIDGAGPTDPEFEKKEDTSRDQDVDRRSAAIRAIRDVEIDHLLTGLSLLRSSFDKDQLQTHVLQFFKENLPNLSVLRNGKDGQYQVEWKDEAGNLSMNHADGTNMHGSLLHQLWTAYPDRCAIPSFGGLELSSQAVPATILGVDNVHMKDFFLDDPSDTQMLGFQADLQTPGVSSDSRMSVGVTPKTVRLPKNGEMILSVHGSPLGLYKENNMESIRESEER